MRMLADDNATRWLRNHELRRSRSTPPNAIDNVRLGASEAMGIEAVVFDIGGVLERTPRTGWEDRWSARLGLSRAEFEARMAPIGGAGSLGAWRPATGSTTGRCDG
jgi:hypothetical protein